MKVALTAISLSRRIAQQPVYRLVKTAVGVFIFSLTVCSCSGSPRYTRSGDSLDVYTPQHLERKVRCCKSSDTVHTSIPTKPHTYTLKKKGKASYYGGIFHGRKTASGEIYNQKDLTAAHRTLPFGTMVRVTNLINNRSVTVRINDRGPRKRNRIIDVSYAAAVQLNMIEKGIVPVSIEIVSPP